MGLLLYVLAVSALWALLAVTAPAVASALAILFVAAIVVPGCVVEIRTLRDLLRRRP